MCNGARLNGEFMKRVIDAGIDFIRFSIIGYNKDKYKEWMNIDNFSLIINNILDKIKNIFKKQKVIVSCYLSLGYTDNKATV